MANLVIKIGSNLSAQNVRNAVAFGGGKTTANTFLQSLSKELHGNTGLSLQILNDDAVAASDTITFSAAATADDTVIINGATFTAKNSGAIGDQWNVGASATATATNLAAAINGSSTAAVTNYVRASSAAGVVTITAKNAGVAGNTITVATGVDSGMVQTVATARLTGGADDTGTSVGYTGW